VSSETSRRYEVYNQLSDSDELWGPLLFLRPAPDQKFSRRRLALVTSLFGVFYGMVGNVILAWLHHLTGWRGLPLPLLPLALTGVSFICAELTFLRAWNSRAGHAARRQDWLSSRPTRVG
jgi:H+/Cl- antiporter ClcA